MMHSSGCEYAIRVAALLAEHHGGDPVKLRDMAANEGIPGPYLSAILPRLVEAGLLQSTRGPTGGYGLARSPDMISLHDIVVAVDGLQSLEMCAAGLGRCSDAVPCPLHDAWKPIRERVRSYLKQTSVSDMGHAIQTKRRQLSSTAIPILASVEVSS